MNTEPRRKASADYHAKRKAAGWKKVTVWLPPEALARLAELKAVHGSNDAAAQAWLGSKPEAAPAAPKAKAATAAKKAAFDALIAVAGVQIGPVKVAPGSRLKKR